MAVTANWLFGVWESTLRSTQLVNSKGHALGGGMLKLEPREAARVVLPATGALSELADSNLQDAIRTPS